MDEPVPADDPGAPFPALTPAQRYHFDVFGYVIIEDTLPKDEIELLLEVLRRLRRDVWDEAGQVGNVFVKTRTRHHLTVERINEYDASIVEYLTHPWVVGIAEELTGGMVRINSATAIINSRDPQTAGRPFTYGFHKGVSPAWGTFTRNGLFHTTMVRAMTNLTELGPDDGGTVLIAGSHKIAPTGQDPAVVEDDAAIIAAAYEDPRLIHKFVAPAGSTLIFSESTIHATGEIRSDRERFMISGVYTPTMWQAWDEEDGLTHEPSADLMARLPVRLRPIFSGLPAWKGSRERYRRYRPLGRPAAGPP
jgi:hypothetical protein